MLFFISEISIFLFFVDVCQFKLLPGQFLKHSMSFMERCLPNKSGIIWSPPFAATFPIHTVLQPKTHTSNKQYIWFIQDAMAWSSFKSGKRSLGQCRNLCRIVHQNRKRELLILPQDRAVQALPV